MSNFRRRRWHPAADRRRRRHKRSARVMKIKHFKDTDTLHIELRDTPVAQTRDLDENTQVDLDTAGELCGITIEHASRTAEISNLSFERVAGD